MNEDYIEDTWMKVYAERSQWIKNNLMFYMRLSGGDPVNWKSLHNLFIALGLSIRQLAAVEMCVGDLLGAGKIIRSPLIHDDFGGVTIRYELPVLERLAAV